MNKSPLYLWLCDAAAEFVEGLADGFIIVSGGTQAAQAITSAPARALTPEDLITSMVIAGFWYVAAFVKKNKPPFGQRAAPSPASTP